MNTITRKYRTTVRPLHLETLDSYTERLLTGNSETPFHKRHLVREAQAGNRSLTAESAWTEIIEGKSGYSPARMLNSGAPAPAHGDGTSCPACIAGISDRYMCTLCAHGDTVQQHPHLNTNVCIKHRRWTGPGTRPDTQVTVGEDAVNAELIFLKLRRRSQIDAPTFLLLRTALDGTAPATGLTGAAADAALYPTQMKLAALISSREFSTHFLNPAQSFAAAYAYLRTAIESTLGTGHEFVARTMWLLFRPTFLSVRDTIGQNEPFAAGSPHDFRIHPAVAGTLTRGHGPLESFHAYLRPTGDEQITAQNHREVLVHHTAETTDATAKGVLVAIICRLGHRATRNGAQLRTRAANGSDNCPYCSHREMLPGFNDLATTHPGQACELDPDATRGLTARTLFAGAKEKVTWTCNKGHTYRATPSNRAFAHSGCPVCLNRLIQPGINDLATLYPRLADEWHPDKNANFSLETIAPGSNDFVFWLCPQGHTFRNTVGNRTRGANCHQCVQNAETRRSITVARPDLAAQWHPKENGFTLPSEVKIGSRINAFWLCPSGHTYEQRPERRNAGYGCPLCSGKRYERGVNDIATRYPRESSEWHSYLNGAVEPSDLVPGNRTFWWKCKAAGHVREQNVPNRVKSHGCPECAPADRIAWEAM